MGRTAGALVSSMIAAHLDALDRRLPAALADEPDAVHQLRISVRRLRSLLAGFRRHLDRGPESDVRALLAEFGAVLGEARDLEVRAAQLAEAAADAGRVSDTLLTPVREEHDRAHARIVTWWDGERGVLLRSTLGDWRTRVPLGGHREEPAKRAAQRAVRHEARRTRARVPPYFSVGDLEAEHALRKAARRLRHVAEAVTTPPTAVLGGRTRRVASAAHTLQARLGEHRDAVLLDAYASAHLDSGPAAPIRGVCASRAARAEAALPVALEVFAAAVEEGAVRDRGGDTGYRSGPDRQHPDTIHHTVPAGRSVVS